MRALIVGSGFIGRAAAARLVAGGDDAVLASRQPVRGEQGWMPLDVLDPDACARTVVAVRPDVIVLVHGPSDVTWAERCPAEVLRGHVDAARNIVAAAPAQRLVLVSTDNVFDGVAERNDESAPTRPANAYGRAKLAAEQVVSARADATVLRVSLVYGWEPPAASWHNFFELCWRGLARGEQVAAPHDHWNTPVLVDDVAETIAAVATRPAPPLLHLGGPDRVSRADWAISIALEMGADPGLVVPVPRATGRYASRPANACLSSRLFATDGATRDIGVRGITAGARYLLATGPRA